MKRFETLRKSPGSVRGAPSPVIWTTIATGRRPEDHGITTYTTTLSTGEVIPISSNTRKAKAIWEVANRKRLRAGVVGWWASWPAEPVDGYVVTDHANPAYSEFLFEDGKWWTADREKLRQLGRDFHPLDIASVLARHWSRPEDFPYETLAKRAGFSPARMEQVRAAPWYERTAYSLLKTVYRIDHPLFSVSRELLETRPADLVMVYFRGPDPVQHYAWDLVEPEKYAVPPENLERDRGLVEGIYRYVDSFVAELTALAGPETWIIIASDHGAEPSPRATGKNRRRQRPGAHSFTAKGVLFLSGPHVKPGYEIEDAGPYDLMPTMAWLLGLPLSKELEGGVIAEAFEESFVERQRTTWVASYGVREVGREEVSPADEAMLENLRALGYLDDGERSAVDAPAVPDG